MADKLAEAREKVATIVASGIGAERGKAFPDPTPYADRILAALRYAELVAVAEAAEAWWEGHRPLDWTPEQHAANPTVNTCGREGEKLLAHAVARHATAAEQEPGR